MSQIICGIDASFTGTAIAIGGPDKAVLHRVACKNLGDGAEARVKRIETIVEQVMAIIEPAKPAFIFLEHYSFGSVNGGEYLGELGGLLRWHLIDVGLLYEVAPTTLKKFVTGKGNTKKEQVIAHVFRQWAQMFETNDHADAFGLYRLGLCACGLAPMTNQAQREAVEKVVGKELLKVESAGVADPPF